jgi:periplasmic protein TonB
MLELSSRRTANPQATVAMEPQQMRRLLIALVLLLVALAAVLIKDRDFWFGSSSSTIEPYEPETSAPSQPVANSSAQPTKPAQAHVTKKQTSSAIPLATPSSEEAPAVTAKRTVLPPLDVEVVAGSKQSNIHPGNNAANLQITTPATKAAPEIQAATNAAQREPIADASQPAYPPLAQHMNVQGSVVLEALIGTDGVIQNLRVTSGPAILASAAQQAVREWRFKPIVQNGQAVESKATITVNFTIKVADNSAKTTIAESRPEQTLILTR